MAMAARISLLGGFDVDVDGTVVPAREWNRRNSAGLVKLLALTPNRRLHREQVLDALWPDVLVDDAAPRLHKAAHYARRALGSPDSVVLTGETVTLWPGDRTIAIDVDEFERAAESALAERRRRPRGAGPVDLPGRPAARRPLRAVGAGTSGTARRAAPGAVAPHRPLGGARRPRPDRRGRPPGAHPTLPRGRRPPRGAAPVRAPRARPGVRAGPEAGAGGPGPARRAAHGPGATGWGAGGRRAGRPRRRARHGRRPARAGAAGGAAGRCSWWGRPAPARPPW